MSTNAMPVSAGKLRIRSPKASTPPAEAPMATTRNELEGALGGVETFAACGHRDLPFDFMKDPSVGLCAQHSPDPDRQVMQVAHDWNIEQIAPFVQRGDSM